MPLMISTQPSPVGPITLVHDSEIIHICEFEDREERVTRQLATYYPDETPVAAPVPQAIADAFERYFAGDRDALEHLATAPRGTAFQLKVWHALKEVRAGNTASYLDLAKATGSAARAIGQANGRNPISLIHPCHRIIGADGSLTGYAGGLSRKEWLLNHEGALLAL